MRIGINGRVLADPVMRGWNRYTIQLLRALVNLGVRPVIYTHRALHPAQASQLPESGITVHQAPPMNYLAWEQGWLPWRTERDRLGLFHSPIHFGLPVLSRIPCILTLHDAIDQVYYRRDALQTLNQRVTDGLCRVARRRADHIITVSEFSRQDLVQHFNIAPERISVTGGAADERFFQPISDPERSRVRRTYQLPERYLFYVGSLEARKNIPFLLRALQQARCPGLNLVLAGGNETEREALTSLAGQLGITESLHLLGRVPDRDLPALYAEAAALVYPSEYEGFGLQLAEAMAVGCPVLAARATCFPEVLSGAGALFALDNPLELAGQLRRISHRGAYWHRLSASCRERGRAFSWNRTARETLQIYESMLRREQQHSSENATITAGKVNQNLV